MHPKKIIFLSIFLTGAAFSSYSNAGISVDFGPFDFHLGGGIAADDVRFVEDPICQAIRETDLVEIFLQVDTEKESQEKGADSVSRLVIEPYTLGYNEKNELVLRGYHIEELSLPESAQIEGEAEPSKTNNGFGFIGGMFMAFKGEEGKKDIKIDKIQNIRVLENTDFVVRDKGNKDEAQIKEVICTIE